MIAPLCDAIVYDLDGTLVESSRDIAEAVRRTMVAFGHDPLPYDAILPLIGDGARALVARAFHLAETDPSLDGQDGIVARFTELYAERACVYTNVLPGVAELLALDVPAAVLTNKPRRLTMLVLDGLGLRDRFRAIYAGGDGPLKPAPDGVNHVLATLGTSAARTWMVGDGPQDVVAGKLAGCFTVAVPGIAARHLLEGAGPDLLVESLVDLVPIARRALERGAAP